VSEGAQSVRVAVVGGGCAALTAAYELTRPEHGGKYEVTVYQMGWRLGGKGASGRGIADRVEEHGLHLWMGFYENAFHLMRRCYEELPSDPNRRFTSWRDAFTPAPHVAVADQAGEAWDFWVAHFPPGLGAPGDGRMPGGPFTAAGYLQRAAVLVGELIRSARRRVETATPGAAPEGEAGDASSRRPEAAAEAVERTVRVGQLAFLAALRESATVLGLAVDTILPTQLRTESGPVVRLIEAMAAAARRQIADVVGADHQLRRVWHVVDLILAILRGATVHRLALDPRGFDAINDYDWRDWLRTHGASEEALDSGFINGIYDLVFGYEDGDIERPRLAAGVALRGAMRMFFNYRGSLFWRMSAGMGDVVFSPLYEVLKARGVRFEFFHRLRNVRLGAARKGVRPYVAALEFDVQARVKKSVEYRPLVDVRGVPSWPASPDWTQLAYGARLQREGRAFEAHWDTRRVATRTLRVTEDFDFVVLGVSIGAIPHVASELIDRAQNWRDMVQHVRTVPTQAFQVWLRESPQSLGWPHPPVNLSGYVQPFDTWADMGHLLPVEGWPEPPAGLAYFCSVLPDREGGDGVTEAYARERRQEVRDNAIRFLSEDVARLWPRAACEKGFRWELLSAVNEPRKRVSSPDQKRFDSQFWTANVNPSDRYVLSLPGTIAFRISPLDRTFDNLTIAGDWTQSGLDSGCIESAVISGRLAAHALCGAPALSEIVGYDHP